MKIAAFFSDSTWASWSLSQGLPEVIRRMGHECLAGALPPQQTMTKAQKSSLPTQEQLESCDVIIICGAEYLRGWIQFLYPEWNKIKAKKCGWFHESIDYALKKGIIYENILKYIDVPFLPNPSDADYKAAQWLPIGVDTEMFKPCHVTMPKPVEIGFTGLMYDKRAQFLGTLIPHIGDLEIRFGNLQLLGADSDNRLFRRQTEMLAKNYCEMEILLNLPSLSNVLVMKILEAMACGTFVCTPQMESIFHEKLALEDGKDLVFYQTENPAQLADVLRYFAEHDEEREAIAKRGRETAIKHFSLGSRIESLIGDTKVVSDHKLVSVLIPSRGKQEQLKKSIDTLLDKATHPERIEILVRIDDDEEYPAYRGAQIVKGQRRGYAGLHHYYNELASKASGEWLLIWNDDAIMETQGWDARLGTVPAKMSVLNSRGKINAFPFVHKSLYALLGHIAQQAHVDTWLQQVSRESGCEIELPLKIDHATREESGGNYQKTRSEYFSKEIQDLIKADIGKVKNEL